MKISRDIKKKHIYNGEYIINSQSKQLKIHSYKFSSRDLSQVNTWSTYGNIEKKFTLYIFESKSDLDYIRKVVKKKKIRVKYRKEIKRNYPSISGISSKLKLTKLYDRPIVKGDVSKRVADSKKNGYQAEIDSERFDVLGKKEEYEKLHNISKSCNVEVEVQPQINIFEEKNCVDCDGNSIGGNIEWSTELQKKFEMEIKHPIILESTKDGIDALEKGIESNEVVNFGFITSKGVETKAICTDSKYTVIIEKYQPATLGGKMNGGKHDAFLAKTGKMTATEMNKSGYLIKNRRVLNDQEVKQMLGKDKNTVDKGGFIGLKKEKGVLGYKGILNEKIEPMIKN